MALDQVEQIIGSPADYDSRDHPFPVRNPYGRYALVRQVPRNFGHIGAWRKRRERYWTTCGLRHVIIVEFDAQDQVVSGVTYVTLHYSAGEPLAHTLYRWLGL